MPTPWNNWYHSMGNTYATWPPGDARGFRARHHRDHFNGDYKNPPAPGEYELWLQRARLLMPRNAVILAPEFRPVVCREFVARLHTLKVEVIEMCVTGTHFHILSRFTPRDAPRINVEAKARKIMPGLCTDNALADGRDPVPRHCLGVAKKHTSFIAHDHGYQGGLWAVRTTSKPIADRAHQLHVVQYIRDHIHEGGSIWSYLPREDSSPL